MDGLEGDTAGRLRARIINTLWHGPETAGLIEQVLAMEQHYGKFEAYSLDEIRRELMLLEAEGAVSRETVPVRDEHMGMRSIPELEMGERRLVWWSLTESGRTLS